MNDEFEDYLQEIENAAPGPAKRQAFLYFTDFLDEHKNCPTWARLIRMVMAHDAVLEWREDPAGSRNYESNFDYDNVLNNLENLFGIKRSDKIRGLERDIITGQELIWYQKQLFEEANFDIILQEMGVEKSEAFSFRFLGALLRIRPSSSNTINETIAYAAQHTHLVKGLDLSDFGITNEVLSQVVKLRHLTDLDLSNNTINNRDMQHLCQLPNLEKLGLLYNSITNAGLRILCESPNLRNDLEIELPWGQPLTLAEIAHRLHVSRPDPAITEVGGNVEGLSGVCVNRTGPGTGGPT